MDLRGLLHSRRITNMSIHPFVLGSGASSRAIIEAWAILAVNNPDLGIHPVQRLQRGQRIDELSLPVDSLTVLCICNPPGLHAAAIQEGERAGFKLIVCEKPACTSLLEVA